MLLASVVATLLARRGILGGPPDLGYAVGLFQIVAGILGLIAFGWSVIGILRPRELPQMAFHQLIPKSGNRFSEKHALGLDPRDHAQT